MKINIQNYESYCLLYIDNELSAAERMEFELFMQENSALVNEFNALQQTVLTPETLLFEDKAILYRYDEMEASLPSSFKQSLYREEAKVVDGYFTRTRIIGIASIAAILLLLLGYQFYFSNSINVKNDKENRQTNNKSLKLKSSKDSNNLVRVDANNNLENNTLTKHKSEIAKANGSKLFTSNNLPSLKETDIISQEIKTQDIIIENDVVTNTISSEVTNNLVSDKNAISINNNNSPILNNTNIPSETTENYNTINTDEHDRSIYIANFEIDGDKLRGVTRRINALFKRNKNDKQK